jgi:thiamine biosynthesis protein ThiS
MNGLGAAAKSDCVLRESGYAVDIEISLNGEKKRIREGLTIAELITSLGLIPERLAVEYNRRILKRAHWQQQALSEGDNLEIVHFVGGGTGTEVDKE